MFEDFNFTILEDPNFKEDAVREELIVKILNRLGYSATGENRILRSTPLVHPFVYIGTKSHKINIYPDYLLAVAGSTRWVLDAKSPTEDISKGRHVEQAYSYAMHKDVRVQIYGLCNGRELVIFHVSQMEPILSVALTEIDAKWGDVNKVLSPMAFIDPERIDFLPDYGLAMMRLGSVTLDTITFPWIAIQHISRMSDELYAATTQFNVESDYLATFDFTTNLYQALLSRLEEPTRSKVGQGLSRQPYHLLIDEPPSLAIVAKLEPKIVSTGREEYVPFKVISVAKSKFTAEAVLTMFPYES